MYASFLEKRAFPRFTVSIPVRCEALDLQKVVDANTVDISAQGIGMVVSEEFTAGTSLELSLQMPDNGERINRRARVIWSRMLGDDNHRLGVKLEEENLKPIPLVLRVINYQKRY